MLKPLELKYELLSSGIPPTRLGGNLAANDVFPLVVYEPVGGALNAIDVSIVEVGGVTVRWSGGDTVLGGEDEGLGSLERTGEGYVSESFAGNC